MDLQSASNTALDLRLDQRTMRSADPVALDATDPLKRFRDEFYLPVFRPDEAVEEEVPSTYLSGNSLGLLSKRSEVLIKEELQVWANRAVEAHFNHPHQRPWAPIADLVCPSLARLVGAELNEVACMGSLTLNLHLMMTNFYNPNPERFKIICEVRAFPSDQYAFHSQAALHGFDPAEAVVEVSPRQGEHALREEDIMAAIEKHGDEAALVLFSGVQYYTGQWFPMERITKEAKSKGCIVGFDLAHAVGNVPMSLHDWGVDFAVWCSYKYLNSGPGGIGGLFVHSKWDTESPPKLHGWWGHNPSTRFRMPPDYDGIPGASGYQVSNPPVLLVVSLLGSLELFEAAGGIDAVRAKSVRLTAFLETRLRESKYFIDVHDLRPSNNTPTGSEVQIESSAVGRPTTFTIITPQDPSSRGAQLSLLWPFSSSSTPDGQSPMQRVHAALVARGVIGDERDPDVIRLSPVPLYNTFQECERAATILELILDDLAPEQEQRS